MGPPAGQGESTQRHHESAAGGQALASHTRLSTPRPASSGAGIVLLWSDGVDVCEGELM